MRLSCIHFNNLCLLILIKTFLVCFLQCPPSLRPFDTDEFLKTLERSGPQLTSGTKGDWEGLYRKFFRSPNFEGWYQQRQIEVNQKLQVLHMEALCNAVSTCVLTNTTTLDIVESFLFEGANVCELSNNF
mgnify:CR=1 FL=1